MLHKLWIGCFATILIATLFRFSACAHRKSASVEKTLPQPTRAKAQPAAKPPPAETHDPKYTYVGQGKPVFADEQKPASETGTRRLPQQDELAASEMAQQGEIPDLDIRLGGNDISRVIAHYRFQPAVKSRTRLLGKIAGGQFVPISPAELADYATRGRSGMAFPDAKAWLKRISRELALPEQELSLFFLVPHAAEAYFIEVEKQALARAAQQPKDVRLIRAHYNADLEVIVDELVLKTGQTLPVD